MGPSTSLASNAPGHLRIRWWVLTITSLILVLNYADRSALGVAGSTIITKFSLTKTEFGFISSIFFLGYAPFCFIGGALADKYGPRRVMGLAVAWWSLFTAMTAAGTGYLSFLVIRFLFGFGEGPQGPITVKTMRNWFPQRQMGTAVGISQGCTPLGGVIGTPLVAGLIAYDGNWRLPFIVLGLLGLVMTVGWFVIVRDTPAIHPWAGAEETAEMNAQAVAVGAISPVAVTLSIPSVGHYIRKPHVLATALAFFGYAWVLYTFLSWFPIYLVEARGLQLKEVAWVGAIPWAVGVVGYMLGGISTDWLGARTGRPAEARRLMIMVGLAGTAILLGCIGFVTTLPVAVLLMSGVVFLLYLTGSQYFLLISDTTPVVRLGGVVGFVHFLANLSGILAPVVVGVIVDQTKSWLLTFGVSAAVCVLGVIAVAIWGRDRTLLPA